MVVTVNHGGNLQLGPDKVELGNLKGALRQAIAARGGLAENEAVIIKCDRSVDYGIVARVMARIKEAGYRKLSLVTETEGG